jgi:uncharacterized protein YciI
MTMRSFLVFLADKRRGGLTPELLGSHVEHLKRLRAGGQLPLCGPLADDDRAVLLVRAATREEAVTLVSGDPLVSQRYYRSVEIHEMLEAGDENNWLADSDQTRRNLGR